MIKNYSELQAVKKDLKNRLHETEQEYASQHEWISEFLKFSGVHDGKKNQNSKENIHIAIVEAISEFIRKQKIFKKFDNDYTRVAIPFVLTLLSIIAMKKL